MLGLIIPTFGQITISDCLSDCSMAWLYKDAHKFGLDQYKQLIGGQNVICEGYGPILDSANQTALSSHFQSCPGLQALLDAFIDPTKVLLYFRYSNAPAKSLMPRPGFSQLTFL